MKKIAGMGGIDRMGRRMTFPMSNRIWVFTGGAHGAGGFSENRGFRNMAGLFERSEERRVGKEC